MQVQFLGQEDPLEEGMATTPVLLPLVSLKTSWQKPLEHWAVYSFST